MRRTTSWIPRLGSIIAPPDSVTCDVRNSQAMPGERLQQSGRYALIAAQIQAAYVGFSPADAAKPYGRKAQPLVAAGGTHGGSFAARLLDDLHARAGANAGRAG